MNRVVIFGAGGLGELVHDILQVAGTVHVVGFLDSDPCLHGQQRDGLPVLGGLDQVGTLRWSGVTHAVVAIGDNQVRTRIADALTQRGLGLISAIHPQATIAPSAELGRHLIIGARVTVCVHAVIEDHCVISSGAIIEHDNHLGPGAFIHPAVRLAGGVRVEAGATLEIGASVIPGVRVGRRARVRAGAVVIRDIADGREAVGMPAEEVSTTPAAATHA